MDLKRSRKKLKQKLQASVAGGFHVYRSENKNAPFAEWERITTEPVRKDFVDLDAKRRAKFYYYKTVEVDAEGNEYPPIDQNTFTQNGRRIERTPENSIMGSYLYWTTDPDLPLERWTKIDELVTDENASFQSPVKQDFYVCSISVNFRGEELQRSGVQKVIYKGPA
jgi:hypothetical protein